jgi:hypothetical protein
MNTRAGARALLVWLPLLWLPVAWGCAAPPAASTDPLADTNGQLRELLAEARRRLLARETFVLVGSDELFHYRNGERRVIAYTPREYHLLKTVAHIPPSVYGLFALLGEGPYDHDARQRITAYAGRLDDVGRALPAHGLSAAVAERQRHILHSSGKLLSTAVTQRQLPRAQLESFCAAMRGPVLDNAHDASRYQLEGLNTAMTSWQASLADGERATFHAVVSVSHQARDDNLQTRYFRALLDEPGPVEERIVVAEGLFTEEGMYDLLATHILDGGASRAFFADDKRLQRDVLGDAAREIVPTLALPK